MEPTLEDLRGSCGAVGKWIRERNNRDEIFLATKYGVRPTGKNPDGSFAF